MTTDTLAALTESVTILSRSATEEDFQVGLFGLAREYAAAYLQLDFDREVLPFLHEPKWWLADYGVSMRGGVAVGMAIKDALKCLVDVRRTFLLAQGIKETVAHLKQTKPRLTAIEPGTGTGILAILLAVYGVERVIAIEYNSEIFAATQDFIKKCGLEDKITVIEGDATTIALEPFEVSDADLLVSENLSTGLMDEPQYEMIAHLSRYLAPDAEILPCRARLSVALGDSDWRRQSKHNIGQDMLPRCNYVSEAIVYAEVPSVVGMKIPVINTHVTVPCAQNHQANSIILHVDFQINRLGTPVWIHSGDSQFVGRPWTFRLDGRVKGNTITVHLTYQAGRKMELIEVRGKAAAIEVYDSLIAELENDFVRKLPTNARTRLLKNRDVDWDGFDPYAYKRPNYTDILPPDRQIVAHLVAFYRAHPPKGKILEVGPGSNLYPIFAALPYADEIICIEKGAKNVAYLKQQLIRLDQEWLQWIKLFQHLGADDPNRPYHIDFRRQLKNKIKVRQGDIFRLPKAAYDGGSMHLVAESLTQDLDEFYAATHRFIAAIKPKCPFATSFMKGSTGYDSPGKPFPAVPVTEKHISHVITPLSDKVHIRTVGSIRKGHAGIITALGNTY